MQNEMNCESKAADEARERVEEELSDLCEKMSKLTVFLYGEGRVKANLSDNMINLMTRQLDIMKNYATTLQTRLSIWGKSNKELESLYDECRVAPGRNAVRRHRQQGTNNRVGRGAQRRHT